jgi:hypothetical protein
MRVPPTLPLDHARFFGVLKVGRTGKGNSRFPSGMTTKKARTKAKAKTKAKTTHDEAVSVFGRDEEFCF